MTLEELYPRGTFCSIDLPLPGLAEKIIENIPLLMHLPNRAVRGEEPVLSILMHKDLSSVNLSGGHDRSTHHRSDF